jgi:hypothetical protein
MRDRQRAARGESRKRHRIETSCLGRNALHVPPPEFSSTRQGLRWSPFLFSDPSPSAIDQTIFAQSCEKRKAGLSFLRNSQLNPRARNILSSWQQPIEKMTYLFRLYVSL